NVRRALILGDGSILPFFTRPISLFFIAFILFLVLPQIPAFARLMEKVKAKVRKKKSAS
ncbi:MAG TPA: transporter, partial [Clostridiales bacterium]|nr:transporter [Clostridiales bacterium]